MVYHVDFSELYLSTAKIHESREALTYRLTQTKLTSDYKVTLGINFVDCNDFDYQKWVEETLQERGARVPKRSSLKRQHQAECLQMIRAANTFDPPTTEQGWEYMKPQEYLAAAFVDSGLNIEDSRDAIATMVADQAKRVEPPKEKVHHVATVRTGGSRILSTLGKSMRSAWPSGKRQPILLSDKS